MDDEDSRVGRLNILVLVYDSVMARRIEIEKYYVNYILGL